MLPRTWTIRCEMVLAVLVLTIAWQSPAQSVPASAPADTFSLKDGREPVTSPDGKWHFHRGDDSHWSDPDLLVDTMIPEGFRTQPL